MRLAGSQWRSGLAAVAVVLAACSSARAAPDPPKSFDSPPAFELHTNDAVKHSVPLEDVHKGIRTPGDPRDKIPPIDGPWFEKAKGSTRYAPEDRVLAFEHDGVARAYPLRVLTRHEIVNDMIEGLPVAIVYCPLCNSGSAFDRRVGGVTRRFGVSGYLYQSDVLLWDDHSESFWSQIEGAAVVGPETGTKLTWLNVANTTYGAFQKAHPDGEVLVGPLGDGDYARDPYAGWEDRDMPGLYMDPARADRRFHQKAAVTGVMVGQTPFAILHERAARASTPVEVEVAGQRLTVAYDAANDVVTVTRRGADGRPETLPALRAYWFAWATFHPDTKLFEGPAPAPGGKGAGGDKEARR